MWTQNVSELSPPPCVGRGPSWTYRGADGAGGEKNTGRNPAVGSQGMCERKRSGGGGARRFRGFLCPGVSSLQSGDRKGGGDYPPGGGGTRALELELTIIGQNLTVGIKFSLGTQW